MVSMGFSLVTLTKHEICYWSDIFDYLRNGVCGQDIKLIGEGSINSDQINVMGAGDRPGGIFHTLGKTEWRGF
jgi:hypothetical protein